MEVNGAPELLCFPHSSEYLPLCSVEQRHVYRFGTTWGWVYEDNIFVFGWTIPLKTGIVIAINFSDTSGTETVVTIQTFLHETTGTDLQPQLYNHP